MSPTATPTPNLFTGRLVKLNGIELQEGKDWWDKGDDLYFKHPLKSEDVIFVHTYANGALASVEAWTASRDYMPCEVFYLGPEPSSRLEAGLLV